MKKEYPNSDVLERAYLVWMFHNPELRAKYLDKTLPSIFLNPQRRLLIFVMQKMTEENIDITVPNMALYIQNANEAVKNFMKRHKVKIMSEAEIQDTFHDMEITANISLFDMAKDYLLVYAFARFVEDKTTEIKWMNSYPGDYESGIVASCRGVIKVYDVLHGRLQSKRDQLAEAMESINSDNEYVSTSSQVLNAHIGGWTRGYVGAVIAKSSHGKSTWTDYDTVHSLLSNKIGSAAIISPEESASTRWRRIICGVFKIPSTMMRQKTAQVTQQHIDKISEMFKDRLFIYDDVFKYKSIIDLMHGLKVDKIVLDHLQAIEYPGTGDFLARMIGGIPGIIDFEKKIAKQRKNVIINLSQVNDKDIQRSDRLIKAPRYWDAYASSTMYQASREFLSLWYPIKDYEDNPIVFGSNIPTINDLQISVEKSSFSRIGKVKLFFDPEFNVFKDKPSKSMGKGDYVPPKEKELDYSQEGLFK